MRSIQLILFFINICSWLYSQNIVINGSFENYDTCPSTYSQIYFSPPWFQPSTYYSNVINSSSTDFFNSCTNNILIDVPKNFAGYQSGRTGNGYSGMALLMNNNGREYIEGILKDALLPGQKYCAEFYVSLADSSYWAISNIGLYFSLDSVLISNYYYLPYISHISNSDNLILKDTSNWMKIQGVFLANGGERFITIGNFTNNENTNAIGTTPDSIAYYYIDDVSVYEIDENFPTNLAGLDNAICRDSSVQIGKPAINGFKYLWSPSIGLSSDTVAQPTANPLQTTKYILQITNDSVPYSCKPSTKDTVIVTVVQPITINAVGLAGVDTSVCENSSLTLGKPAIPGHKYFWEPTKDSIARPLVFPDQSTSYILFVDDTSSTCKASGTDIVTVSVINCDTLVQIENNVFLPSIFSPNGDGNNDNFRVKGENLAEIHLTIYNRWGEKVFETENKTENWTGTYQGQPLNTGVFVYYLKINFDDGEIREMKGNVTLVR